MAEIQTGQYEVIFRKNIKWNLKKGDKKTPLVAMYLQDQKWKSQPEFTQYKLVTHIEIRKDIKEYVDQDIAGKRVTVSTEWPIIKEDQKGKVIVVNPKLLKQLYDSVDADPSMFTRDDLAQHIIDKPVLMTINVNPDGYGGRTEYHIVSIEPSRNPVIQPSALVDDVESADTEGFNTEIIFAI